MLSYYVWTAYVFFIIIDTLSFGTHASNWIKYSIIICLFLHSVFSFFRNQSNQKKLSQTIVVTIALFLAVCADYFLLFTKYFSIGILFFIVVQFVYSHMLNLKIKEIKELTGCKVWLFLLLQTILFLLFPNIFLYLVAGEYACFLLRNMFISWYYHRKIGIYLPLTITLLFLCDCNVLLANITDYKIFWRLIWIFYVPSQFILEKYVEV